MPRHLTTNDISTFVAASEAGEPSGVATLDSTGKVPVSQLPSSAVSGVSSVNTLTGAVVLNPSIIGAVSTGAIGQPNGVAALDSTGKLPLGSVPSSVVTNVNGYSGSTVDLTAADVNAVPASTRRLTIFYSPPFTVNGRYSVAYAEQVFSSYDQIVFNSPIGTTIDPNTVSIIAGIKRLNPNAIVFGYVDIGITSGPTDAAIDAQISAWNAAGCQGVFFDRAGWYDAATTRVRQNTHVATAHGLGMVCILNCFSPDDAYLTTSGSESSSYWSSFNPGNVAPLVGPNDWYLLESWVVNTNAYSAAPPAASSLGYAGMNAMQDRGDRAVTYRNAGGPKIMAVGLVEYYKNTDATALHFHRMTEAAAIVWGLDSYGTCAYEYAATGSDVTVLKTYPYLPDAPAVINRTEKYTAAVYQRAEREDLGAWINVDTTGLVSPVPTSATDPVHFNWGTPSRSRQDNLLTVAGPITTSSITASGLTMTGPAVLAADPTTSTQASTKNYVDTSVSYFKLLATASALGNVSGSVNVDLSTASTFTCTITGNTTFSFINWPTGSVACEPTIIAKQDSTGHTIAFSGVTWLPSGSPPLFLTGANQVNVVPFFSADNGTTIYGQGGSSTGGGFGVYGDGSDGAIILDGTNTYSSFMGKSGNFYWLTRDIYPSSLTINAGVSLQLGTGVSYRIMCNGTVSIAATAFMVSTIGTQASGATGGTNLTGGTLVAGSNGPNGTTGGGVAGVNAVGLNGGFGGKGGNAGSGGNTAGTNGVALQPTGASVPRALPYAATMSYLTNGTIGYYSGGATGSPGAGDGTNAGGGAGAGGNQIYLAAENLVNNGTISSHGGNGGNGAGGNAGGGGGGQGGPVMVIYGTYTGSGTISSTGGNGGTGAGTGGAGATGGSGWIVRLVN